MIGENVVGTEGTDGNKVGGVVEAAAMGMVKQTVGGEAVGYWRLKYREAVLSDLQRPQYLRGGERDADGNQIANGTYIYKLIVESDDGQYKDNALGKLSVIR